VLAVLVQLDLFHLVKVLDCGKVEPVVREDGEGWGQLDVLSRNSL
jgi:hypothetical protein